MANPEKQLELMLRDHGFKLVRQGVHLVYKSARLGNRVFVTSATPSDCRWAKRAIAILKQVIAQPPRAELLAIEEFERERAAQIGLKSETKASVGLRRTGGGKSRGTGFYYDDVKEVELTEAQVAERERIRLKREADEAAWKAERQVRRDERRAREETKSKIEIAVNRGMQWWFAAREIAVQEKVDDYCDDMTQAIDNLDEACDLVRAQPALLAEVKKAPAVRPNGNRPFHVGENAFSIWKQLSEGQQDRIGIQTLKHAILVAALGWDAEQIKKILREAVANKTSAVAGPPEDQWTWHVYEVPKSISPKMRRHLKSWFNSIYFGFDAEPYEFDDDDYDVGLSHVEVSLTRARFPSPKEMFEQLQREQAKFEDVRVVTYGTTWEPDPDGEEGEMREKFFFEAFRYGDHGEAETLENMDLIIEEELFEPLALIGLRDGQFSIQLYPVPEKHKEKRLEAANQYINDYWLATALAAQEIEAAA